MTTSVIDQAFSGDDHRGIRDEIHVWWVWLDEGVWPNTERLSGDEQERATCILGTEARRRWVVSRWALREVLAGYVDQSPEEIRFRTRTGGKLMLAGRSPLRFNLSHSECRAVVAVARQREVGVDIENVRHRRGLPGVVRRALPPEEAKAIEAGSPSSRLASFHSAWARTEAIAKCTGMGLASVGAETGVAVQDLDAGAGFAAAVAIAGERIPLLRHFAVKSSRLGCCVQLPYVDSAESALAIHPEASK